MLDGGFFQRYKSLEFIVQQLVEGFMTGLHKSPFHGFSVEFAEHRLYNQGESTRHIDWKLYARTDKLFVKRYEEETNLRAYVIIDNSSSMHYPVVDNPSVDRNINKSVFAAYAAGCVSYLLQQQRDATGLSVFSDEIDVFTPVRSSYDHLKFLYGEYEKLISDYAPQQKKKSNVAESLHLIAEKIHKRSLIVLFTDMFDNYSDDEALFSALQHLKYNKNEMILFHVTDKNAEINLNLPDKPTRFIDMETKSELKVNPRLLRKEYSDFQNKRINEIKSRCLQYKIDFVDVDISEGYNEIMLNFLKKRQRLM